MFIANVVIPNFWVKLETLIKTEVPTFDAQYLWGSAVGSMTIQMANIFKKRV